MDQADQTQDAAERLAANLPQVRRDGERRRSCVRCGELLPAGILRGDPDALDCGGGDLCPANQGT